MQSTVKDTIEDSPDRLETMLQQAYSAESVPAGVNTRLQNRLACREVMTTNSVSFWWLPATISTILSIAFSIILCLGYVLVNIAGANSWMPNLLQLVSEPWLKLHLVVIALEVVISWLITFISVWKGNLVRSAKML